MTILWSTNIESGLVTGFDLGGDPGGEVYDDYAGYPPTDAETDYVKASTDVAHSGTNSMLLQTDGGSPGEVRIYKYGLTTEYKALYYSFSFYYPSTNPVIDRDDGDWCSILQFKSKNPADGLYYAPWNLSVYNDESDSSKINFLLWWAPEAGSNSMQAEEGPTSGDGPGAQQFYGDEVEFTKDAWHYVELYYDCATDYNDFDGHLTLWVDGIQLFDMADITNGWDHDELGSVSNLLFSFINVSSSSPAADIKLYFDDITVSTNRLGGRRGSLSMR